MGRDMVRYIFSIGFCLLGTWVAVEGYELLKGDRTSLFDRIAIYIFIWSPVLLAVGVAVLIRAARMATFSLWVLAMWWLSQGFSLDLTGHIIFSLTCIGYLFWEGFGTYKSARSRLRMLVLPAAAFFILSVPGYVAQFLSTTDKGVLQIIDQAFGSQRILFLYGVIAVASFIYDWCSETPPQDNAAVESRA
ncbi:MAG: hypothetical protein OXI90_07150 [Gammaproteobacteria bacterium]|nr:hypothetical protein [Gammaproteobacteria bacterium]